MKCETRNDICDDDDYDDDDDDHDDRDEHDSDDNENDNDDDVTAQYDVGKLEMNQCQRALESLGRQSLWTLQVPSPSHKR